MFEKGKWLLGVTSCECRSSIFNITDENTSFSITIPGHCEIKTAEKTIDGMNKLLELRCLELHLREVRKRGNQLKIGDDVFKLSDLILKKIEYLKN